MMSSLNEKKVPITRLQWWYRGADIFGGWGFFVGRGFFWGWGIFLGPWDFFSHQLCKLLEEEIIFIIILSMFLFISPTYEMSNGFKSFPHVFIHQFLFEISCYFINLLVQVSIKVVHRYWNDLFELKFGVCSYSFGFLQLACEKCLRFKSFYLIYIALSFKKEYFF